MTFPNWHEIGQIARDGQNEYYRNRANSPTSGKKRRSSRGPSQLPKARWFLALTLVLFLSAVTFYAASMNGTPASVAHQSSTPSPAPSPKAPSPQFDSSSTTYVIVTPSNVAVGAVGTTFTVQIKVRNMPQFNGWDIQVWAAPWVLNATSLSITGNDFAVNASSGTAFEITHCVNGAGTGCTSADHAGYVHSAFADTGIVSGNGLLFTITYKVVGNAAASSSWYGYSPILPLNIGISDPNSSSGITAQSTYGTYGTYSIPAGGGGGSMARRD